MHLVTNNRASSPRQHGRYRRSGVRERAHLLPQVQECRPPEPSPGRQYCGRRVSCCILRERRGYGCPLSAHEDESCRAHLAARPSPSACSFCGNIWMNESQKWTNPMRFGQLCLLYYSAGVQKRVPLIHEKRSCYSRKTGKRVSLHSL